MFNQKRLPARALSDLDGIKVLNRSPLNRIGSFFFSFKGRTLLKATGRT